MSGIWLLALIASAQPLLADLNILGVGDAPPVFVHVDLAFGDPALVTIPPGPRLPRPFPVPLAPSQVITLYASTNTLRLSALVTAKSLPLPTELAGVSVWLSAGLVALTPVRCPLFQVAPIDGSCDARLGVTCPSLVAITLQAPYGMRFNSRGEAGVPPVWGAMYLTENSVPQPAIGVNPVADQIRILTYQYSASYPSEPGLPIVTHADGSYVTPGSPARAGETVAIWAVGLYGWNDPLPPTGGATSAPLPSAGPPVVRYDFRLNAPPQWSLLTDDLSGTMTPAYAGLSPGSVGLYQVNFKIPPVPAGVQACTPYGRRWNMTVTLIGQMSFDGGGMCVVP